MIWPWWIELAWESHLVDAQDVPTPLNPEVLNPPQEDFCTNKLKTQKYESILTYNRVNIFIDICTFVDAEDSHIYL